MEKEEWTAVVRQINITAQEDTKMADIRDSKNWGFETRQLHIGQEQADPATDARAVPIYATTPMYSMIRSMRRTVSV